MFLTRFSLISLLLSSAISCAPLPAHYDFDRDTNFGQYQSYQWQKKTHKAEAITDNSLLEKRIHSISNQLLASHGIDLVKSNPDFLLTYHITTRERLDVRDYGYDYWPYRYGPATDIYQYTEGTLIIDMIDAKTNKLIWRGWANRIIDQPSLPEVLLEQVLGKIFDRFPL